MCMYIWVCMSTQFNRLKMFVLWMASKFEHYFPSYANETLLFLLKIERMKISTEYWLGIDFIIAEVYKHKILLKKLKFVWSSLKLVSKTLRSWKSQYIFSLLFFSEFFENILFTHSHNRPKSLYFCSSSASRTTHV